MMRHQVERELMRLGGLPKNLGYFYIVEIVTGMREGRIPVGKLGDAYEAAARQYGATPGGVERDIRYFIKGMWQRGNPRLHTLFCDYRPTNKELIGVLYRGLDE